MPDTDPTSQPEPAAPEPTPTAGFTQADLDAAVKKATADARKTATADLTAKLGGSPDDAAKVIAAVKAAEEAQKSDAQKALDAAAIARAEAEAIRAEAATERLAVKVERKLLAAGIPDAALARAARLITVAVDADDDTIDAEIVALRTDLPALFTPPPAGATPPPGINPTGTPTPSTVSAIERGAELFAARKQATPAA